MPPDMNDAVLSQLMAEQKAQADAKREALAQELAQRKDLEPMAGKIDLTPMAQYLDDTFGGHSAQTAQAQNAKHKDYETRNSALLDELSKLKDSNLAPYITARTADLNRDSADKRSEQNNNRLIMALNGRNAQMASNNGIKQDRLNDKIYGNFDNNPVIIHGIEQRQNVDRALDTLNSPSLTPQQFNDAQAAFANAINKGGSHAASKEDMLRFNSLELQYTNALQKFTGDPQAYKNPKVLGMMRDFGQQLRKTYSNNIVNRAQQLAAGRKYGSQAANDAVQSKVDAYKAEYGEDLDDGQPQAAGGVPAKVAPPAAAPKAATKSHEELMKMSPEEFDAYEASVMGK